MLANNPWMVLYSFKLSARFFPAEIKITEKDEWENRFPVIFRKWNFRRSQEKLCRKDFCWKSSRRKMFQNFQLHPEIWWMIKFNFLFKRCLVTFELNISCYFSFDLWLKKVNCVYLASEPMEKLTELNTFKASKSTWDSTLLIRLSFLVNGSRKNTRTVPLTKMSSNICPSCRELKQTSLHCQHSN